MPDPTRSSVALALSAVALRAQAQYHSLGAAIETDLGAARRAHRCGTVEACLTSCAGEWHRYVGGLGPLGEP